MRLATGWARSGAAAGSVPMRLRLLGFCGVDDSVDPRRMLALSRTNPFIEWGVLVRRSARRARAASARQQLTTLPRVLLSTQFNPGREGTPRYASSTWVDRMLAARRSSPSGAAMRLAAHLCGPALNQVLRGDTSFVEELAAKGFGRVQLNATAVRGAGFPLIRTDAWSLLIWVSRMA